MPYSPYTYLAVGYGVGYIYGGATGPGTVLGAGDIFESLSVRITLHDSSSIERQVHLPPSPPISTLLTSSHTRQA